MEQFFLVHVGAVNTGGTGVIKRMCDNGIGVTDGNGVQPTNNLGSREDDETRLSHFGHPAGGKKTKLIIEIQAFGIMRGESNHVSSRSYRYTICSRLVLVSSNRFHRPARLSFEPRRLELKVLSCVEAPPLPLPLPLRPPPDTGVPPMVSTAKTPPSWWESPLVLSYTLSSLRMGGSDAAIMPIPFSTVDQITMLAK